MSDEESGESYKIYCKMGSMKLTVEGSDDEWVEETFEEKWERRMEEAADMEQAIREQAPGHQ